jgi:hypothetical protein
MIKLVLGGDRDYAAFYSNHVNTVLVEKEKELRLIGATDEQVEAFLQASMNAMLRFIEEYGTQIESEAAKTVSEIGRAKASFGSGRGGLTEAFQSALKRTANKEFTLGCIEFEEAFRCQLITYDQAVTEPVVSEILGSYLACCCATGRQPELQRMLFHPQLKARIMEVALSVMKSWDSDPVIRLINFVRQFS